MTTEHSMMAGSGRYRLRPYQKQAADDAIRYFSDDRAHYGALMVLPTGSGKSLVIAEIARQLSDPVLIFQPSKEILEQNYGKFVDHGLPAAVFSASVGIKRIGKVTFATIGSAINRLGAFRHFPNIIIDECHLVNAKGGMYRELIEAVGGKVLGLTATPYRLTTDGYGGSILKFLTRTRPRVFVRVIHVTQNGELFAAGHLARLEYHRVEGFESGQLRLNSTGADYDDRSVKAYYGRIGFPEMLFREVSYCLAQGRKSVLVFTRFVEESRALAAKLPAVAEIVSAETPKREREGLIRRFRSGQTRVVSNVGVLTTGFDFPELDTIVIARPTMSLALYYQMIGRGIRPHPGKESAWVVDLCDNFCRFGKVEDLRIIAPRPEMWHVESNGMQLTNVYFGDPGQAAGTQGHKSERSESAQEQAVHAVTDLKCPECGAPMRLRFTQKYLDRAGNPRPFYGCTRWPDCSGAHGAHPDGRPLGVPADAATKRARIGAHSAMDAYLAATGFHKSLAYAALKQEFGAEVHIGELDTAGCERVVRFFGDRLRSLSNRTGGAGPVGTETMTHRSGACRQEASK